MAYFKEDWEIPGHWFDYYAFLGIKMDASSSEIEKAFKAARKKYHPDVNKSTDAKEMFEKIYIAYQVLSDPIRRQKYDNDYRKRMHNTSQNTQSHSTTNQNSSQNTQRQGATNQNSSQNTQRQGATNQNSNQNTQSHGTTSQNTNQNTQSHGTTNQNSSQNTQRQGATNQNSNQNTQSQNYTKDDDISFDDIVENFKKNPFDQESFNTVKMALNIIIKSFKEYAQSVDEVYFEFYNAVYNENMDKADYISTSNDLQTIILEQIKSIKDLKRKYNIVINRLLMKNEIKVLNEIIKEYQTKLKRLSFTYEESSMHEQSFYKEKLGRYYANPPILSNEFSQKRKVLDDQFEILKQKIECIEIDDSVRGEVTQLLKEYESLKEWVLKLINDICCITKQDTSRIKNFALTCEIILNAKIKEISVMQRDTDTILYLNSILNHVAAFYQKLDQYSDISNLAKMVDNGDFDAAKFNILKRELTSERTDICNEIDQALDRISRSSNFRKFKEQEASLKLFDKKIEGLMYNEIMFSASWDSFCRNIQSWKELEYRNQLYKDVEKTAMEVEKELQPVIDFLVNLDNQSVSYNYLIKSSSFKKVDELIALCNNIGVKMQSIPPSFKMPNDLSSPASVVMTDYKSVLNTLENYKKFVCKMASFENFLTSFSQKDKNLESLFYHAQLTFKTFLENTDDQNYGSYERQIGEINTILKEANVLLEGLEILPLNEKTDNNICIEQKEINKELKYFYKIRKKKYAPHYLCKELDLRLYKKYCTLKRDINDWIGFHSPQQIRKMQLETKLENIKEKTKIILDCMNQLFDSGTQGKRIDWQQVFTNRSKLEEIADEVKLVISNNSMEEDISKSYWQFYQELNTNILNISATEEKVKEQLKLQTLELLKAYNQQKAHVNQSSILSNDELNAYIKSFYDYQMAIIRIQSLSECSENDKVKLLEGKINVYQTIITEINLLKPKAPDASELENKYIEELNKIQKDLYYAQNEDTTVNLDNLWSLRELEEKLKFDPLNTDIILNYLEIIGKIAEEKYLATCKEDKNSFAYSIKTIEAKREALIAQREALCQYAEKNALDSTFKTRKLNKIQEDVDDCTAQLSILNM